MLVDTMALLRWLADDARLPEPARAAIADPARDAFVSAVSVWEAAIKTSLGKLPLDGEDLPALVDEAGFALLPVTPAHAWAVERLPFHHRDPFDRLIAAQALHEGVPLVSGDTAFDAYGVTRVW
jgi:PIN domain nuclease of toxin-antitoxin system